MERRKFTREFKLEAVRLIQEGLVLRDPAPRLMSQSFRQFVLSQESRNCTGSLFSHCTIGPHVF
jgi:hypothetical protein